MFSVQFFCILLIADSLDLTGQTDFFEFHILYSVHYNSVITIRTNEMHAVLLRSRYYYNKPAPTCCGPYWPIIRKPTILQKQLFNIFCM